MSTTTLLHGGAVIDGTGSAPQLNTSVFIEGEKIVAVGTEADALAQSHKDVQKIDVSGLTVMPGLIDAHTHVTLGEPASNDELFHHREPATAALIAAHNVKKILQAGVTSILDVDGIFNIGPALRDAINAGITEGPSMKSGTFALMTAVGGTAGRMIPDHGTAGYAEVVHNRDEMVRVVRRQIKDGADIIKIHVTGVIPARSGEIQVWTRDELKTVCDTAHDLGIPVTAHCRGDQATLDAVLAGVDIIWHASFLGDRALEAIIDKKTAVGPVFTFLANLAEYGAKVGATASVQSTFAGELEQTGVRLRQAYDAGVPLLCGSESGFSITPYGNWHAREMEVFVQHMGLTPLQAISCATYTNAHAIQQFGQVGIIATGAQADILVLDGHPEKDVAVLGDKSSFRHLFKKGRAITLAEVPERSLLRGERIEPWSAQLLKWDLIHQK